MKNKRTKKENKKIDPIQQAKWEYAHRIADEFAEVGVRMSILDAYQAGANEVLKRNTPVNEVYSKEDDDLAVSDVIDTQLFGEIVIQTGKLTKLLEDYTDLLNARSNSSDRMRNEIVLFEAQTVIRGAVANVISE